MLLIIKIKAGCCCRCLFKCNFISFSFPPFFFCACACDLRLPAKRSEMV